MAFLSSCGEAPEIVDNRSYNLEEAPITVNWVPHNSAIEQLMAGLDSQSSQLKRDRHNHEAWRISTSNIEKLRPVVRRQRLALISSDSLVYQPDTELPMTGEFFPISTEVVGSISRSRSIGKVPPALRRWRAELNALRAGIRVKPVSVVYIGKNGKSSTLFEAELARALLEKYGNSGLGLVMPAGGSGFDATNFVRLTTNGSWRHDSSHLRKRGWFGLSGMSMASRSSLASMKLTSLEEPFDWVALTVATGPSQGRFSLQVGDTSRQFDAYSEQPGSEQFRLDLAGEKAVLVPGGGARTIVLNWSIGRNMPGVRFSRVRINTDAASLNSRFLTQLMQTDIESIDPDLVILDMIPTDAGSSDQDIDNHVRQVAGLVDMVKTAAPNAGFVHIGSSGSQRFADDITCGERSAQPERASMDLWIRKMAAGKGGVYWDKAAASRATCRTITPASYSALINADVPASKDIHYRAAAAFVNWLADPANIESTMAFNNVHRKSNHR